MVDIQTVSIVIASAGVLIGVAYYILDMRHQNKMRRTDLVLRLASVTDTSEYMDAFAKVGSLQVKDYEDYVKQYGPLDASPMHKAFVKVIGFYGLLGQLLKRKLIEIDLIYDVVGTSYTPAFYERVKPIIIGVRKELNEPAAMIEFQYLVDELKKKEPQLKKTWKGYFSPNS
jgi:hypothetical protein